MGQEPVFPATVTDAMVEDYVAAVDANLGSLTAKDWEIERFDPAASVRRVAKIGLAAMLSALPRNGRTPLATLRFDKKAPGHENEMPHVISCNRLPDGDYEVYAALPAQSVDLGAAIDLMWAWQEQLGGHVYDVRDVARTLTSPTMQAIGVDPMAVECAENRGESIVLAKQEILRALIDSQEDIARALTR